MKRKMKSVLALCAAVCAAAGCSGGNAGAGTSAATTAAATTTEAAATTTTAAPEEFPVTNTTTGADKNPYAAEGTVIFDANDIKITAAGFSASEVFADEKLLDLDIVNNTGKALEICPRLCSMSGIMLDVSAQTTYSDGMTETGGVFHVPAANDTDRYALCVVGSQLEEYGLTDIPDLEFMLDITVCVSDEEYSSLYTDIVRVDNPAYDEAASGLDDSGEVMYDKDGVKIVMQGETYDADYWGPQVKLYAFNGTDKPLFIRIAKTVLDGTEYDAYGDMEIAPGRRLREEVLFGFTGDPAENMDRSMTEVPAVSEIEMSFEIYEYDAGGENKLITASEPCRVTVDPDTVEKTSMSGNNIVQLSEEEITELKGWWTREGGFRDDDNNSVTITFIDYDSDLNGNGWYVNGNFNEKLYWGGTTKVTGEGLSGTAQTVTKNENEEYIPGDPIEIKVAEDGDSGIVLTLGTGEEYHLIPSEG